MRSQRSIHDNGGHVAKVPDGYTLTGPKYAKQMVAAPAGKQLLSEIMIRVGSGESLEKVAIWYSAQVGRDVHTRTIGTMVRVPCTGCGPTRPTSSATGTGARRKGCGAPQVDTDAPTRWSTSSWPPAKLAAKVRSVDPLAEDYQKRNDYAMAALRDAQAAKKADEGSAAGMTLVGTGQTFAQVWGTLDTNEERDAMLRRYCVRVHVFKGTGPRGSEHLGKAGLLGANNRAFAEPLTDGAVTAVVVYDPTRI
jgi:hypothetical protein